MSTFDPDQFDAYVRDEAADHERRAIEARLREDAAFAAEWRAHEAALQATERDAVRDRIAAARSRYNVAEGTRTTGREAAVRPLLRRSLAIAAAIAMAIVAGALWFLNDRTELTPDLLAVSYFEPAIGLPTRLGPAEDMQFEGGMVDYKLGEYELAIAAWAPLLEVRPGSDTLAFYLGVAQLGAKRPGAATELLGRVTAGPLAAEAQWYRALALLQTGDVEAGREVLRALADGKGRRAKEAGEVLGAL